MWTLTQTTPLDATEPSTIKSISLSNSHVSQNRESTKAIWKVSIGGENSLSLLFGIAGTRVPGEEKKKRLPRNPGKEVIAVVSFIPLSNLEVSITAYRLLHGRRTFVLGESQSTAEVSLEYLC